MFSAGRMQKSYSETFAKFYTVHVQKLLFVEDTEPYWGAHFMCPDTTVGGFTFDPPPTSHIGLTSHLCGSCLGLIEQTCKMGVYSTKNTNILYINKSFIFKLHIGHTHTITTKFTISSLKVRRVSHLAEIELYKSLLIPPF